MSELFFKISKRRNNSNKVTIETDAVTMYYLLKATITGLKEEPSSVIVLGKVEELLQDVENYAYPHSFAPKIGQEYSIDVEADAEKNIVFANYVNQARWRYSNISIDTIVKNFYKEYPQYAELS